MSEEDSRLSPILKAIPHNSPQKGRELVSAEKLLYKLVSRQN